MLNAKPKAQLSESSSEQGKYNNTAMSFTKIKHQKEYSDVLITLQKNYQQFRLNWCMSQVTWTYSSCISFDAFDWAVDKEKRLTQNFR